MFILRHNYREFDWKALLGWEGRVVFNDVPKPAEPTVEETKGEVQEAKKTKEKAEPLNFSMATQNFELKLNDLPASPALKQEAKGRFLNKELVLKSDYQKELNKLNADKSIQLGNIKEELTLRLDSINSPVEQRLAARESSLQKPETLTKLSKALGGIPISPDDSVFGKAAIEWATKLPEEKFQQIMDGKLDINAADKKEKAALRECVIQTLGDKPGDVIEKGEPALLNKMAVDLGLPYAQAFGKNTSLAQKICLRCDIKLVEKEVKAGDKIEKKPVYMIGDKEMAVGDRAAFESAVKDKAGIDLSLYKVAAEDSKANETLLATLETKATNDMKAREVLLKLKDTLRDPKMFEKMGADFGLKQFIQLIAMLKQAMTKKPPDLKSLMDAFEDISAGRDPEQVKENNRDRFRDILASGKVTKTPNDLISAYLDPSGNEAKNLFGKDKAMSALGDTPPPGMSQEEWVGKDGKGGERAKKVARLDHYMGETVPDVVAEHIKSKIGVDSIKEIAKDPASDIPTITAYKGNEKIMIQIFASGGENKFAVMRGADTKFGEAKPFGNDMKEIQDAIAGTATVTGTTETTKKEPVAVKPKKVKKRTSAPPLNPQEMIGSIQN